MCGRFAMTENEENVMNDFQIQHSEVLLEPRYNCLLYTSPSPRDS